MTVHPLYESDAPVLTNVLCACGKPVADHKCPSSVGYAPRAPKTAICRQCGLKAHQNIDGITVRLECLWRQWAASMNVLEVKDGAYQRVKLPVPDAVTIGQFAQWVAAGSGARDADGSFLAPDTAAVLKRMQQRAVTAAPMPDETPQDAAAVQDAVTATTNTLTVARDDQDDACADALSPLHPSGCDDGCAPSAEPAPVPDLPTVTLDAELSSAAPADYSDLI